MGRHGISRGQRQLRPLHLEELHLTALVQIPIAAAGHYGVEAWLFCTFQLPVGVREFEVDDGGAQVVLGPRPRMHNAYRASQELLAFGPVNVLCQGHPHTDGQRQGSKQVARVLVVVLEPPEVVGAGRVLLYLYICFLFCIAGYDDARVPIIRLIFRVSVCARDWFLRGQPVSMS